MNTKLKWHYQADGAWQLTHAECGTASRQGLYTTPHIPYVTCKRCLKKLKPTEEVTS